MQAQLLAKWEATAREAAADLCAKIDGLVTSQITIITVPIDAADGSNSSDGEYLTRLRKREHLTDAFLSDH